MLGQIEEYTGFMSVGKGLMIVPFRSENEFNKYMKEHSEVRWAHLIVRDTGMHVVSSFNPHPKG